jgi:hypothetical protein
LFWPLISTNGLEKEEKKSVDDASYKTAHSLFGRSSNSPHLPHFAERQQLQASKSMAAGSTCPSSGSTSGQPPAAGSLLLKAPVNAAAIAVGDMGASGGAALLSPSRVEKRQ